MSFNPEEELRRLLARFDLLAGIVRATWYEWRQAALEFAKPGTKPLDLVLRAWEIVGHDTAMSYFMALRKDRPTFLKDLGRLIVMSSRAMGEDAVVVEGDKPNEVFVQWNECPWPEFARRYKVDMEEDVLGCDNWFQTVIADVNKHFGTKVKLETLKAIPRGDPVCLRRLSMEG